MSKQNLRKKILQLALRFSKYEDHVKDLEEKEDEIIQFGAINIYLNASQKRIYELSTYLTKEEFDRIRRAHINKPLTPDSLGPTIIDMAADLPEEERIKELDEPKSEETISEKILFVQKSIQEIIHSLDLYFSPTIKWNNLRTKIFQLALQISKYKEYEHQLDAQKDDILQLDAQKDDILQFGEIKRSLVESERRIILLSFDLENNKEFDVKRADCFLHLISRGILMPAIVKMASEITEEQRVGILKNPLEDLWTFKTKYDVIKIFIQQIACDLNSYFTIAELFKIKPFSGRFTILFYGVKIIGMDGQFRINKKGIFEVRENKYSSVTTISITTDGEIYSHYHVINESYQIIPEGCDSKIINIDKTNTDAWDSDLKKANEIFHFRHQKPNWILSNHLLVTPLRESSRPDRGIKELKERRLKI